jgi:hypothetical protein
VSHIGSRVPTLYVPKKAEEKGHDAVSLIPAFVRFDDTMGVMLSHSRITKLVVATLCTFALLKALLFVSHRYYPAANDLLQLRDHYVGEGNDRALTDIRNETLGVGNCSVMDLTMSKLRFVCQSLKRFLPSA